MQELLELPCHLLKGEFRVGAYFKADSTSERFGPVVYAGQ